MSPTHLDLADYRRRIAELYGEVRRLGGSLQAWELWRHTRDELFATHPQTPLDAESVADFDGIPCFDHDPRWRLIADVELVHGEPVEMAHSDAGMTRFVPFATAHVSLESRSSELTLYWLDSYGGGIFVPFRDTTSGSETYGGGRYLLDTAKGADLGSDGERLILDFNFAYHPSCVHSAQWSCPLAPPANRLDVPIRAGERLPT